MKRFLKNYGTFNTIIAFFSSVSVAFFSTYASQVGVNPIHLWRAILIVVLTLFLRLFVYLSFSMVVDVNGGVSGKKPATVFKVIISAVILIVISAIFMWALSSGNCVLKRGDGCVIPNSDNSDDVAKYVLICAVLILFAELVVAILLEKNFMRLNLAQTWEGQSRFGRIKGWIAFLVTLLMQVSIMGIVVAFLFGHRSFWI